MEENKTTKSPEIKKVPPKKPSEGSFAASKITLPKKLPPKPAQKKPETKVATQNTAKQVKQTKPATQDTSEVKQPAKALTTAKPTAEVPAKKAASTENVKPISQTKITDAELEEEFKTVENSSKRKRKKVKKQKTLYAIFGIISDIFVYPVIIIALISSIAMFTSKSNNVVPPIFGFSFVKVLSGSMVASDFMINEIVLVNQSQKNDVKKGDIVAFYYPTQSLEDRESLTLADDVVSKDNLKIVITVGGEEKTIERSGKDYFIPKDKITENAKVYFHFIENVYVDETDGIVYFETKGSSNSSADSYLVREDLIVGKYANTPKFIRKALTFCSTALGMILLVVVPLSILVLLEMLSVLEQFSNIILEKKVLQQKVRFDSDEAVKANIAIELRNFDKVYFYDITSPQDKAKLYDMQWGYMDNLALSKRNQKYFDTVNESLKVYNEEDSSSYWKYWEQSTKGTKKKQKLGKLRDKAFEIKYTAIALDKLLKDTPENNNQKGTK